MRCTQGLIGLAMVLFLASVATAGVGTLADSNGQVVAWGDNWAGQTTVPAGLTNVTGIAGGAYHSLALKSDGTVAAWGDNRYGAATVRGQYTGIRRKTIEPRSGGVIIPTVRSRSCAGPGLPSCVMLVGRRFGKGSGSHGSDGRPRQ
jgi:hypothetical protein